MSHETGGRASPTVIWLRIYDVQGRVVRLLVDGKKYTTGSTRIVWDGQTQTGASTASGVYFVRLEAGNLNVTRKVVLLR